MPYRPPIRILHALVSNRDSIQNLIASSVQTAFSVAQARLLTHVGEVEKLIYFFTEGLPLIEYGMNQLLTHHGVHVTISGIFCHQTPKVKEVSPVATSSSCELGDIAFLSVYGELMGASSDGLGNAVLVQAKERFYPGVSSVQERLYQDVERFEYTSPNPLTSQTRSLVQSNGCLYYWDFDNWHTRWSTQAVLARPLWPTGHITFCFERMLTDLFCGANGRGFQAQPAGDGWSRLIHDLIQNSATRAIRHRRIFSPHQPHPGRILTTHHWFRATVLHHRLCDARWKNS